MNVYDELENLQKNGVPIVKIEEFLIDCVEAKIKFRSNDIVKGALQILRRWIKGIGDRSDVRKLDWYLEAEAFELDHFIEGIDQELSIETVNDLEAVEKYLGLNRDQALHYLRDLAYFIDEVACFIAYNQNGIPRKRYSKFLDEDLFRKSFMEYV